jgi:predicted methyltransferase
MTRRVRVAMLAAAALVAAGVALDAQRPTNARLFPPERLGELAPPDRDDWQQPDRIMDAVGIAESDRVADVAAGGGWFTIRLSRRVGPNGHVYAEDIQPPMIASIDRSRALYGLQNVTTILGEADDPKLPPNLHAVLIVNLYSQLGNPEAVAHCALCSLLKKVAASLAPNGRLGIVDFKKDGAGGPGPDMDSRVDPQLIVHDAAGAGLSLRSQETFLRYQYLLVFGKS